MAENDPIEWHPEVTDTERHQALIIAMAVRNALEELHGGNVDDSITDDQMRRINPLVRNAVVTTLHAFANLHRDPRAHQWLAFQSGLVPSYWEQPELLDDYKTSVTIPQVACRHCGKPIIRSGDKWTHPHADGTTYRGCRAASFDGARPGSAWDETLHRNSYAVPAKDAR